MTHNLLQFSLTALVTLTVVIDPLGVAPIFVAMTAGLSATERKATLNRALLIAFSVTIFFLLAGQLILSYLGVTVQAFGISGGILLFATALPMLFGHRPGLQAPESQEHTTAGEDVAIFPLAIPLLSGPGTIATVILLASQAGSDPLRLLIIAIAAGLVFLAAWIVLRTGQRLLVRLGEGKMHILTRVLGIILAALAVQYVLNGINGYYKTLVSN
jgi:multiple antibiotic resistance protein